MGPLLIIIPGLPSTPLRGGQPCSGRNLTPVALTILFLPSRPSFLPSFLLSHLPGVCFPCQGIRTEAFSGSGALSSQTRSGTIQPILLQMKETGGLGLDAQVPCCSSAGWEARCSVRVGIGRYLLSSPGMLMLHCCC